MTLARVEKANLGTLILSTIGVVYGDIGTSPLYTLKAVFGSTHSPLINEASILGVLSIILWSLIIVVSLKYIVFVMRADNHGEGGVIALTALALRPFRKDHTKYVFIMGLGILGAGLFYGDSVITPAISVLSAIEGLNVAAPQLQEVVLPLTVVVLTLLFLFQVKGTESVGRLFGPVMVLWFLTIACLGVVSITQNPKVLQAIDPYYAIAFLFEHKFLGFVVLGATFLALTGAEALYADIGHFGLKPIRMSWFFFVFPALILNYFGQGALLLNDPKAISQPFYLLAPESLLYPLIVLATFATIIASQAVISGAFSMTESAIHLGYLPAMDVRRTSHTTKGQIYIPTINWLLFVIVLAVVLSFKSSNNLASAYGLSVTGTMVITTILAFGVIVRLWQVKWWVMAPLFCLFFILDLTFLGANSIKIMEGGWLPILIATAVFIVMTTWRKGMRFVKKEISARTISIESFLKNIIVFHPSRVSGTGIYLTPKLMLVPDALLNNLIHNKVLHERIVLLEISTEDRPYVPEEERVQLSFFKPENIYAVLLRFGFKDEMNIPRALKLCKKDGLEIDIDDTSFFTGRNTIIEGDAKTMAPWRKRLFIGLFHNAHNFIERCKIPFNKIIELGNSIEI